MSGTNVQINLGKKNPVAPVVAMAKSPKMLARFQEVLGQKAPQFLASVVSAVNTNPLLLQADPGSVMASAMVAATLNLDVIPGLGFAALVPYWDNKTKRQVCQFQVMTKGFVQLGLRSGQYAAMNVTEIYADEFVSYDPLTGSVQLKYVKDGDRDNERLDKVVGYASYFKLINGYEHTEYWTNDRILKHALRFSKSFAKNSTGLWKDDFPSMAKKTVLKNSLSKWGPLSTDMQRAVVDDQKVYDDLEAEGSYEDNEGSASAVPEPKAVPNASSLNQPRHAPAQTQEPVQEPENGYYDYNPDEPDTDVAESASSGEAIDDSSIPF